MTLVNKIILKFKSKRDLLFLIVSFVLLAYICSYFPIPTIQRCNISKDDVEFRLPGPLKADDPEVLEYLRRNYLISPSDKPYNLSQTSVFTKNKQGFSWPLVHQVLKSVFSKKRNGFFIEAGALDGEFLSNTLWLEKELNWTGLLIEPNPYSFRALLTKNRKAWLSKTCLSNETHPKQTIMVSVARNKGAERDNSWIYKGASYQLDTNAKRSQGLEKFYAKTTSTYSHAQCFPLVSYLLALNRTRVDFLSLDTQGYEWEIVKTIPFDKIKVNLIAVEHSQNTDGNIDLSFVEYFKRKGYTLIGCGGEPDYFFIRNGYELSSQYEEAKKCT